MVGELKLGFNLELVLQGINRTSACDEIWLAVRASARAGRERDPRVRKLCRFLGFGLLGVSATGRVEVLVEPGPWRPRRDSKRRSRLVNEHRRRLGDPVLGGSSKSPIMTAYRQRALACAASLANGPRRTSEVRAAVPDAAENSAAQRLWMVLPRRARRVWPHAGGHGGAIALARWLTGRCVEGRPSQSAQAKGPPADLPVRRAQRARYERPSASLLARASGSMTCPWSRCTDAQAKAAHRSADANASRRARLPRSTAPTKGRPARGSINRSSECSRLGLD